MLLHLVDNDSFLNGSIKLFEQYYPNRNIFIVQIRLKEKYNYENTTSGNIYFLPLTSKDSINLIDRLIDHHSIKHILIHNLTPIKASIANKYKKKYNLKSYWILYGTDLYSQLVNKKTYVLYDYLPNYNTEFSLFTRIKLNLIQFYLFNNLNFSSLDSFIEKLDYFCFWNEFDYDLLVNNFTTKAQYKYFLYYNVIDRHIEKPTDIESKYYLQINHAASVTGNHITVLEKLKKLNFNDRILCPLSYGDMDIKNVVIKTGKEYFGDNFFPILDYLPLQKYYRIISKVRVAIFGNRGQEAAGNVFYLLSQGVKLFLRDDNNMSHFLKKRGFIIYSFEKDLYELNQLSGLSEQDALNNYYCFMKEFSIENEINYMESLIN